MFGILLERLRQKHRTIAYPDGPPPELPERWLGEPEVDAARFPVDADVSYCPTGALTAGRTIGLDVGKCLFCGACRECGPEGGVSFSRRFAMARFRRGDLLLGLKGGGDAPSSSADRLARIRSLFSKSLKLRQVSAGGCNACEADSNVLGTPAWDMGRFGISFVASPRHADGLLITGPVTENMRLALEKTYAAVPDPKVVIAVGACAISGGPHAGEPGGTGAADHVPVDLFIPGCPPHPLVILEGLLRFLGRIGD